MEVPYALRKYKIVSTFITQNSKVLDIGAGTGEIQDYLPKVTYETVELDDGNVNELAKRGVKNYKVDLSKEDIKINDKYDYILLLDVLEHVQDPGLILRNCKKFLNEKGKIIISLPNDYHLLNKLRFIFNRKIQLDPFWGYGHLHIYPVNLGESFVKNCDLKIVDKVILFPEKPSIIPHFIKKGLANLFPNEFCRGVLYICESL